MHCDNAPCIAACPAGAIFKREDGIVIIDKKKCTCVEKRCILSCPYDALYFDEETGFADGCDFCAERPGAPLKPLCVDACPGKAMTFGDLEDPESRISQMMKSGKAVPLKHHLGTSPKVYYNKSRR